MLAKGCYTQFKVNMFCIDGVDIVAMKPGEGAKLIKGIFKYARAKAPYFIFIDNINFINKRDIKDTYNQLLQELHNQDNRRIFLLTATNQPWDLDSDLCKFFQKKKYIALPFEKIRKQMLIDFMKDISHNMSGQDF